MDCGVQVERDAAFADSSPARRSCQSAVAATLCRRTPQLFMTAAPVICFGQQPCGFFPRRFLFAKIQTARRLQAEIGGEIVFFCHDSDHDPRETQTILRHRKTNEPAQLNFAFENRIQRKFSPQYLKQIAAGWQDKTVLQLPNYVGHPLINIFKKVSAANVADFCLEMYRGHGFARRHSRGAFERPGRPPRGVRCAGIFRGCSV